MTHVIGTDLKCILNAYHWRRSGITDFVGDRRSRRNCYQFRHPFLQEEIQIGAGCLLFWAVTVVTVSVSHQWIDASVNGKPYKWENFCQFTGTNKVASPQQTGSPVQSPLTFCADQCAKNPRCTHFVAFPCSLYRSTTSLTVDRLTYNICGFLPCRTNQGPIA